MHVPTLCFRMQPYWTRIEIVPVSHRAQRSRFWSEVGEFLIGPAFVVLLPVIVIAAGVMMLHRYFTTGSFLSNENFDDHFVIEYTDLTSMEQFRVCTRMFMDMNAKFLDRGVQVITLLGVVFVRVVKSIGGRLLLFVPELLFRIPVVTPVYLFRSRGPACPHIPRPPPAFR